MTLQPFNASAPVTDRSGGATPVFRSWMEQVRKALNAASALAGGAVQGTTNIVASGGLQVGGATGAEVGVALYRAYATVAQLPSTGAKDGDWAYAKDGRKPGELAGAGTGVPCFRANGLWNAVTSGVAVTT